jgi:hypothetical protein
MINVDYKLEAFRLATLVLCQSATASKGDNKPSPEEVLTFAKKLVVWFNEKAE